MLKTEGLLAITTLLLSSVDSLKTVKGSFSIQSRVFPFAMSSVTLNGSLSISTDESNEVSITTSLEYCWGAINISTDSTWALNVLTTTYGELVTIVVVYDKKGYCPPDVFENKMELLDFSFQILALPNKVPLLFDHCEQVNLDSVNDPCRANQISGREPPENLTGDYPGEQILTLCPEEPFGELHFFYKCASSTTTEAPTNTTSAVHITESSNSTTTTARTITTTGQLSGQSIFVFIAMSAGILLGIGLIALLLCCVCCKCCRRSAKHAQRRLEIEAYKRWVSVSSARYVPERSTQLTDTWEIERKMIEIDETSRLGQGAFGVVYLGRVSGNVPFPHPGLSLLEIAFRCREQRTVAVKTLSESANSTAHTAFVDEIKLMKSIGYHERLVNLLGCVTISSPPFLVMEYCAHGDLKHFLRMRKAYTLSVIARISLSETEEREYVNEQTAMENSDMFISPKRQLCFSVQVAAALEYLASRGFIHRDVAARNVLVDENVSCKLADFGLCRRVEDIDYYMGRGGRLPLKWMSPEAIRDYRFTVESDVWSFGVVLYEIFTLGDPPYLDVPASEILTRLLAGYRMEKPSNCPESVYEQMLKCWREEAEQRPSFTDIKTSMTALLEEETLDDDYYLRLDSPS